jgi:hypothetical protein
VSHEPSPSRGAIVCEALIFQIKLTLDGLKDIVLAPLSIAAAVLDLLRGDEGPHHLNQVLRLGHRFDHWLDLYGARRTDAVSSLDGPDNAPRLSLREYLRSDDPSSESDRS